MDAEQVTQKILADAQAEADKIAGQAGEKEQAERAEFDQQLAEYRKQTETLAEKAGEEKKAHILAAARMEVAKEYLAEKRKILEEVFCAAREQLLGLGDDEYCRIMTKLMLDAVETGDEEVIVDNNETRIDRSFIKHINRELGTGYQGNLRLAEERQNLGPGFILRRGKIKNNVSIEVLLSQARTELEIELAKGLFEG